MNNITYGEINSLQEICFIAGSTYTIKFQILNQSGTPINITSASCTWNLAPFGTDYSVLTKVGNIISANSFAVYLTPNETLSLSGKYVQQPKITFQTGETVIPAQGTIVIIKGIRY